jgi:uncharacterized membrane-anchored protein
MLALSALFLLLAPLTQEEPVTEAAEQVPEMPSLAWQANQRAAMGDHAEVDLGETYVFLDGGETRRLMELYGNFPSNKEVGLVAGAENPFGWFIVFEFDQVGFVKDDDKEDLDAQAMLESYREGSAASNKKREDLGMAPLNLVGWKVQPNYDATSHNLEWCLEFESQGSPVLNHNIRLLGRKGTMNAVLVCQPEEFDSALAETREVLKRFSFKEGHRYGDFVSGDKVAEYGLTALVAGGAVAVAAKSGLLGKLIKPLILGLAVVGAFFKNLIAKIFGGKRKDSDERFS